MLAPPRPWHSVLCQAAGAAMLAGVAIVAVVLIIRRVAGGANEPLSIATAAIAGAGIVLLGLAGRILLQMQGASKRRAFGILSFVAVAMAALALLPGLRLGDASALVLLIGTGELVRWSLTRYAPRLPTLRWAGGNRSQAAMGNVVQQVVRRIEADGAESIRGRVRIDVAPQQRTAVAHVAFCPPLKKRPVCAAELVGGPSGSVRVTHVYVYGARFEVRLDQPASQSALGQLEFVAREPSEPEAERTARRPIAETVREVD